MLHLRMLGLLMLIVIPCGVVSTCPAEINPLKMDPAEITIKYGEKDLVNCTSQIEDHEGMYWCNETKCNDVEVEVVFIAVPVSASKWDVNVSCKIKLNATLECSKELKITVYKGPDSVNLHPVNAVVEGKQHKLQCDIINVAPVQYFTVKWYKDNKIINTTSFSKTTKTPVNESSFLAVEISREEKEAQFKCEALLDSDSEPVTSNIINVSLHYAPELINKDNEVFADEDTDVTVSCEAVGNPPPLYNWTRDEEKMFENNVNLTITKVNSNATYSCTATNDVGSKTKRIHIYVKKKFTAPTTAMIMPVTSAEPVCRLVLMPSVLVVRFGDPASINCSSLVPDFSKLGWEAPFGASSTEEIPVVTWRVNQLEYWNVEPFCYVTLENGEQCTLKPAITVYKTPDYVLLSTPNKPMVEGSEYKLQCDIINVAPVQNLTVKWYRGSENVHSDMFNSNTQNMSVSQSNVSYTWTVIPNRSYNGVQFKCEAVLQLGSEPVPTVYSEPYTAVVHFAPFFKQGNDSVKISRGGNVTFGCHAEGNPAPEIHWNYTSADNIKKTTWGRHKNITIQKATSTSAGVYMCVATNKLGEVTRFVTLKIKDEAVANTLGLSWWYIVLFIVIIISIVSLVLILIVTLRNFYTKRGQYRFRPVNVNGDVPLTTMSSNGTA